MANTLGNPTLSAKARENQILSYNSTLTSDPVVANPIFRVRRDSTTLVDYPLDPTTPMIGGVQDGAAALNLVSSSVPATGGTATIPNNYQIIGRDNVAHMSGAINATDGITVGQNVSAASILANVPAS